jgi:threonine dehydratase
VVSQCLPVRSEALSAAADATYRAYHEGHLEPEESAATEAEGIASRAPFALTVGVLRDRLADLVRVPEPKIRDVLADERLVIEGACGAAVAAVHEMDLAGETVVVPITDRNLSTAKLSRAVDG